MKTAIKIFEKDHVATATSEIDSGESIFITGVDDTDVIEANEEIPMGHKIALKNILRGEEIVKYGEVIGVATGVIHEGSRVHIHNCWGLKGRRNIENI